jgi:hypothetical protein
VAESAQCFSNTTWVTASRQDIRVSLWRQGANVVYQRKDGRIINSTAVNPPVPEAFDIDGLRLLHGAFYNVANLTTDITEIDTTKIVYHSVEQATAWISGDIGERGSQGDDATYWSTLAMGSLLIVPLMDFTNNHSLENIVIGSSATATNTLIIPYASVIGYSVVFLTIVSWAGYNLWRISGQMVPNSSYFPEIDFASKCVMDMRDESGKTDHEGSIGNLLHQLSNETSKDIWGQLEGVINGKWWKGTDGPVDRRAYNDFIAGEQGGERASATKYLLLLNSHLCIPGGYN